MLKIVILGSAHPLRGGGLATFNERLARAFMDAGHQVTIYTFSLQYPKFLFPGKSQHSDEEKPDDLDIRIKVNSINPLNWQKVGKELKRLKPDMLLIRYWLPFMAPCLGRIATIVKKNRHTRIVAITDNIIPHEKRPGDRLLTRYFVSKPDAFVCMTKQVQSDLESFAVPREKIGLYNHPLYDNFGDPLSKADARKNLKIPPNENIILFFGFIREYKGLDLLIRALGDKRLKDLNLKLLVAGEFYVKPDSYHALARECKVMNHIYWHTDFIPNDQVRNYFCAADLVAQPYKHATQSGVTQVAYHFNKPMLVTRVGGLPEMVKHNEAGYVVPPDPSEIAASIEDFFKNDRSDEMVISVKREKKRFSWEQFIKGILKEAKLDADALMPFILHRA